MRRLILIPLCLAAVAACTHDPYRYGPSGGYGPADYDYAGDDWGGRDWDDLSRLDPWFEDTREGQAILSRSIDGGLHPDAVRDLNIRFRRFADTDGDLRLTDEEIRLALVRCASYGWSW
jgi:hypothetical protein